MEQAPINVLQLYKRALDASSSGIIITDANQPDMPIVYVNHAFERITGYPASEILGRNCRFLQGDLDNAPAREQIRQALATGQECQLVLENVRKDGSRFWNQLYLAPVKDELGQVQYYIGAQNDISAQIHHQQELEFSASHDQLTGLPNRRLLEDRLLQACRMCARCQRSVAVLFIDLDGFKLVNDSLGHQSGDLLLQAVANRLSLQLRPGDTCARLGGDEFVVVLPDLAREQDVVQVAERILLSFNEKFDVQQHELRLSASIGIALSDGRLELPLELIKHADIAMYKAKQLGRNNFQWYSAALNCAVDQQLSLRNQIRQALQAGDFQLYYQPQLDACSGRIIGFEALLRWPRPASYPNLGPAEFVPIAEDSGLIAPLSLWVFTQACLFCKQLQQSGWPELSIAVNVSSRHFHRPDFVSVIEQVLGQTGLDATALELELTEAVLFDNAESAINKLQQLKRLRVRISLDDFGTGFSSLNHLKRLPIDKIKIDRSFIRDVISDKHDAAISKGIINMAHLFGLRVIAEGVETASQMALLSRFLCDEFQGFYIAAPMPEQAVRNFLIQHKGALQPDSLLQRRGRTVLLLDDEENILHALVRLLRKDHYKVLTARTAEQAFELLAMHQVQVVVSDQRMPEMCGTEFLSRVKDLYPKTIRLMLSGYTDLKTVTAAINNGAIYRFLTKPWNDQQLRQDIQHAFLQYEKSQRADGGHVYEQSAH